MKYNVLKWTGKCIGKAVRTGTQYTRHSIEYGKETRNMLKDNQERWKRCIEQHQMAVTRLSVTIEKTMTLIAICKRYGLDIKEIPLPSARSLEKQFPDCNLNQHECFIVKGVTAGITSVSAALGTTALCGTASTGAAISSLHGAASIGAILADLGGGSAAAGGLGIAGGIAVLGSAFAIPAIGVGSYLWDKSIREQHEQLIKMEKQVNQECSALFHLYMKYDHLNINLIQWLTQKQKKQLE